MLWWHKFYEWVWRKLPDRCQADYCEGYGVRGNENLYPSTRDLKPLILCDYCGVRYQHEGQLKVNGKFYDYRIEKQAEEERWGQ